MTQFGFTKKQLKMIEVIVLLNAMALSILLPTAQSTGEIPSSEQSVNNILSYTFSNNTGIILNDTYPTLSAPPSRGALAEAFNIPVRFAWATLQSITFFINGTSENYQSEVFQADLPSSYGISSKPALTAIATSSIVTTSTTTTFTPITFSFSPFTLAPTIYEFTIECVGSCFNEQNDFIQATPTGTLSGNSAEYITGMTWHSPVPNGSKWDLAIVITGQSQPECLNNGDTCHINQVSTSGGTQLVKNLVKGTNYCSAVATSFKIQGLFTNKTASININGQYTFRARNTTVTMEIQVVFAEQPYSTVTPTFGVGSCVTFGYGQTNIFVTTPNFGTTASNYVTVAFSFTTTNQPATTTRGLGIVFVAGITIMPVSNSVQIDGSPSASSFITMLELT